MAGAGGGSESASSRQHIKFDKDDKCKGDAKTMQPKKTQSRRNKRKRQNPSTATADTASSKEEISSTATSSCEKKLFNGLTLAISINQNNNMQTTDGDVSIMKSTNQKSLKQTLKLHGATISPQIHKRVHYLICSNNAIQNITRPVRQAYKRNVDIVNVDWVNKCVTMNTRVNADDYICNDLVGKLIDEKEKEKNLPESGIDDGYKSDALPDEETTGWSTPIQLDCCCVCHENGDFKCPWCTGEQSCNLTLARLAKKQKKTLTLK